MARCEFIEGLGLVSGTLHKETHYENGKRVTTRLLAKVINGKQHIYLRSETEH